MIVKRKWKVIKNAMAVAWWMLTILLVLILINVIGAKLSGKVPAAFGFSIIHIVSGSMEQEIPKDSYILIKAADASEIQQGDIICFYSTDPQIYGMPNTHRVVRDPIVTENGIEFVTRGDANAIEDKETAKGERLIGIYVKKLDGLTAFSQFLSGKAIVFAIVGMQLGLISMIAYGVIAGKQNGGEGKADKQEKDNEK